LIDATSNDFDNFGAACCADAAALPTIRTTSQTATLRMHQTSEIVESLYLPSRFVLPVLPFPAFPAGYSRLPYNQQVKEYS
jgi:hypothetical protein